MATVFEAVHRNKKRAAIKMLHPEFSFNENIRERFLREGYVANSIDHPGVVRVDDDDIADDGVAYLVMERLRGESVDDRLERLDGTLPLDEVLTITDQLLDVLKAAHAAGVVHRDLKPENLFLTTAGQLKVLDFGIARLREVSSRGGTSMGSFMGTPSFMSPEQARGRWDEVDERSDIWAVGATMYALLTGHPVHDADTVNEQLVMAATVEAPSLRIARPDLPGEVISLVDRALVRDPTERWQSADAMQGHLRASFPNVAGARAPEGLARPSGAPVLVSSPPEHTSGPNDPTMVSSRGTSLALATSVPLQRRGGRWLVVGAIALGICTALVLFFRPASKDSVESGTQFAGEPRATMTTNHERSVPPPPAPTPTVTIAPTGSSQSTTAAASASAAVAPARPPQHRATRPKSKDNAAPASAPTHSTSTDPFDRHF
jgi:serine/threonine-protein kinase